jgi:glutamyl-tRNA reductase
MSEAQGSGDAIPSFTRHISMVGASHHTASVDLRERLAFPEADLAAAIQSLLSISNEALILSTCNRTEIYVVGEDAPADSTLLADLRDVSVEDLADSTYQLQESEAVRHLLQVASGLDSMVLGETQILGQVRDAFDRAIAANGIGRVLGRLLPLSLEVGKRARSETTISRRALSPSSVAVELARQTLGDLRPLTALVVGAGEAGRAAARSLKDGGVSRTMVANRTPERGEALADLIGGEPLPYEDLVQGLIAADIVIASTGASDHVVTAEVVRDAMKDRTDRPLLCIDIAMPRDIDPEVAAIPGVVLHNIDDLEAICAANLRDRANEIAAVETIVEDGLADYLAWRAVEPLVPTIGALYQRAEGIRRAELDRTLARLDRLSEQDRDLIDVMTASIVRRLLHTPVATIKAHRGEERAADLADLTQELFALASDAEL